MNCAAFYHSGIYPEIYASDRHHLNFSFHAATEDVEMCTLIYFHKNHRKETTKEKKMTLQYHLGASVIYTATVAFQKPARYLQYYFQVKGKNGETVWYNAWGVVKEYPDSGFFEYAYANNSPVGQMPPKWGQGTVYYQIFPERFRRGNALHMPENCQPWGSRPTSSNFMGGDLEGIRESLGYLERLGVECIYINPVFQSPSNHKYDTTDYYNVDCHFGTNDDLRLLVKEAHEKKIRVILDAVFNHTGTGFFAFADIMKNQEKSKYRNWYFINKYPVKEDADHYECFFGFAGMPKLNTGNEEVQKYFLKVLEYWIQEVQIDGYRYDVIDEIDENFIMKIRDRLKRLNPELVLIGETWAEGKRLLNGCGMDSIMNYSFREAILDFLARRRIQAEEFGYRLERLLSRHPMEINTAMFNALDTHDTERFMSSCEHRWDSWKLGVVMQMLFVGSPSIYYGDENGMDGENDPDCRKCMIWNETMENSESFKLYQNLISFRKRYSAIRDGSFSTIFAERQVYGFSRQNDKETIMVFINNGDQETQIHNVYQNTIVIPSGGFHITCIKKGVTKEEIIG